jgi:hypothetical protein
MPALDPEKLSDRITALARTSDVLAGEYHKAPSGSVELIDGKPRDRSSQGSENVLEQEIDTQAEPNERGNT